jgi:hypothetical protein
MFLLSSKMNSLLLLKINNQYTKNICIGYDSKKK